MRTTNSTTSARLAQGFGLPAGSVFRRRDVADNRPAVDRELAEAVKAGVVCKARQGLYYVPKQTPFGKAPPSQEQLVEKFLDDSHFLLFNPSCYNALGLGLTQLYNTTVVYNHKRHGKFTLAGFEFEFRDKPRFPKAKQVSKEYLLVDLVNNLDTLAEDPSSVMKALESKLDSFDRSRLDKNLELYGSAKTKRYLSNLF